MTLYHFNLVEVDSLEAIVVIDNDIDIMSTVQPNTVINNGRMPNLSLSQPEDITARGYCRKEMPMKAICCGAHGLSILVTVTKDNKKHSMLFDTGPEEDMWERNAKRLDLDLANIEKIQLSHWHRDHSGGMLAAIRMVTEAKTSSTFPKDPVIIDLYPSRPDYRGFMVGKTPISMEADPSFAEMEALGAKIERNEKAHTVLDDMFLVSGEIPRVTGYETGVKNGIRYVGEKGEWIKDEEIRDERFLLCNLKGKGIVMFTGCSHGGVVNASRHAKELLNGEVPLYAVVGGYHLVGEKKSNVQETVKDLKALSPKVLLPGHCSGWRVKFEIEREMPGTLVPCSVGARFTF